MCSLHLVGARSVCRKKKRMWGVDNLGNPHDSNSGNPETQIITNLCGMSQYPHSINFSTFETSTGSILYSGWGLDNYTSNTSQPGMQVRPHYHLDNCLHSHGRERPLYPGRWGWCNHPPTIRVCVTTTPATPWEGLVFVPSTIASTPISPMAILFETTTV